MDKNHGYIDWTDITAFIINKAFSKVFLHEKGQL